MTFNINLTKRERELRVNLGDGLVGIDQAASLRPTSMPSVNLTPVISFGNWF